MGLIIPLLFLGLMSSLSPSTIVLFILLLGTTRPRANSLAFLLGWGISLTLVFYLSYVSGQSHALREESGRTGIEILKLFLGLALIVYGSRQWSRRHLSRPPAAMSPTLSLRLRGLDPRRAVVVGILKQPWAITASAAVVVLSHQTAFFETLVAFLTFTAVSTASVAAIFYYYTSRPEAAEVGMQKLLEVVTRHSPEMFAVVAVTVGFFLTVDGVRVLLLA